MSAYAQTTGKIGVWNLAGFKHSLDPDYRNILDQRLTNQVEGLCMMDADIVTLVEVKPHEVLDMMLERLAEKGLIYKSVLLPQESDLNLAVIYKQGISATNPRFIEGSDLGDSGKRKAFVVDMKMGKFDFHLIAVHLKSGRAQANQLIRDEQAKVIGDFITQLRGDGREDILLMGDFNMIPGQDVSNFYYLGADDTMDFLSSWDLQERFSHILPKGRANLLDGYAISRTYSTEYIRGSLRLFPMHWAMDMGREKFREEVSDHLPFVASFRIDRTRAD